MHPGSFAASAPYPSVEDIQPNIHDLHLILNDYAGLISELSAVTQYVYHQLNAKEDGFYQLGQVLLSIAKVEMRHLDLLGSTLCKLGGSPQFIYRAPEGFQYWNAGMIDDLRSTKAMVQSDLLLERQTIAAYEHQSATVNQSAVKAVLDRLILDEECHVTILKEQLQLF